MKMPAKNTVNFLLEGATLAVLATLAATGVLMKFILPPGSGRGGAEWLGLGRHDWGGIHFWLAAAFLALLLAHLLLHWRWVWAMAKGKDPARQRLRGATFLAATACFVAVAILPFAIPTTRGAPSSDGHQAVQADEESRQGRPWRGGRN